MLPARVSFVPSAARRSGWRRRGAALLLAFGALVAQAQPPARWSQHTELSFQHLTQAQGLPNEIATAVAQDGDGFLWVGTLGGLARWDGYRMRVYTADARTAGALPDNVVQVLFRDAVGRLWIGTSAAGLVRYDAASDRFVRYAVGPEGLAHVSVRSIADGANGELWVATDAGLDRLDPATGRVQHETGAGLPPGPVNVVLRDRAGVLWVGTPGGLFRRGAGSPVFVPVPMVGGVHPEPIALAEDARGALWIGTARHGAFELEGPGRVPQPVAEALLQSQQVNTIVEVRPGEVWLGTASQGIVAVESASGSVRRIANRPTLPVTLADNALRHLFRDRAGLVWAATNRGVSRHDPRQSAVLTWYGPSVREETPDGERRISTEVSWILPMDDGRLWLATHKRGVDIIDASGALVGALRPDASRPRSALPADIVLALERAPDGSVFIGTKRGLYRASADGRRVARVEIAGRDPAAATWALLVDGRRMWIGGRDDGLWAYDLDTGTAAPALRAPGPRLSDERIIVLAKAKDGALWVGTRNGLNRVEPDSGRVQAFTPQLDAAHSLPAGFITTLHTDAQGRLWVGTYGGGIAIQEAGSLPPRFTRLSSAQGLPDDNVNALVEGPDGAIWASTDSGLARIAPADLAMKALRRAEGVALPTYWTGSAARTDRGELLFGGAGGVTIVRPAAVQDWAYRPPVLVSELSVGGVREPAARHLGPDAEPVIVPASANALAVEFSAIDYSAPERNRYAYRLEGFDADWIETDPARRLAAYTNLPPGDYTLMLRGSNRDGAWSERTVALPVRVLPAWHQTWWARSAIVLGLAVLVFVVVQGRTRALRARQAELERKVRERTAELEAMSRALEEKSRVLERSAITDPLTGLHNRRFLTEQIDAEITATARRAAATERPRERAPVDTDHVFYLVDVDRFKQVNDQHGHAAGDAVLVQFGQRLLAVLRESDHLVRWGGEEFLAVARETDRARAEELAERMRLAIAETPFQLDDGRRVTLTASIGFACLPFGHAGAAGPGWQEVVRLADVALFAAKRAGRDTWVGLHPGPAWAAHRGGLPTQGEALAAVHGGVLRATSNRAPLHVVAALASDNVEAL